MQDKHVLSVFLVNVFLVLFDTKRIERHLMRSHLFASSALAAMVFVVGPVQAAQPLELSIGGFGSVIVGYASQDSDHLEKRTGGSVEVSDVDVKGDNELHFKAQTVLDNGMVVSMKYEIEAGGQQGGSVDNYSISLGGAYGTLVAGATDMVTGALASRAPHMGQRLFGDGLADCDLATGTWVLKPSYGTDDEHQGGFASVINSHNDNESISYISPSFAGFTLGATYVPEGADGKKHDSTMPHANNTQDMYAVALAYENRFGGLTVASDVGWATLDTEAAGVAANRFDGQQEVQAGLNLGYAGVTVGGGYRLIKKDYTGSAAQDRQVRSWEAGVGYRTGPYGVAIAHAQTRANFTESSLTNIDLERTNTTQLTAEYAMGPGVLLVGGVGHVQFETEGQNITAAHENSGWVAATGLSLSF